ncbi:hypothetical protein OEM_47290 [Mycobacterium intracellulare subsp. yongonense 05-1390]|nr:hypothetical protein OEM_47290 [Mycobacterium intracellulare subsp. yongonense 05-1390]
MIRRSDRRQIQMEVPINKAEMASRMTPPYHSQAGLPGLNPKSTMAIPVSGRSSVVL